MQIHLARLTVLWCTLQRRGHRRIMTYLIIFWRAFVKGLSVERGELLTNEYPITRLYIQVIHPMLMLLPLIRELLCFCAIPLGVRLLARLETLGHMLALAASLRS